jgi:WD40 repeat protein
MVMFVNFRFGERYTYGYVKDQIFSHDAEVIGISSSADGLQYATAAADGSVKVWRIADGEEVFSANIEDLSLRTLTEEWVYANLSIFVRRHDAHAAISADGNLFAQTASDLRSINLIDVDSGEVVKTLAIEQDGYFALPVFSPDGKTVAAAFNDRQIIFWDVDSGLDILRLTTSHTQQIMKLAYSPDGSQIGSQSEGQLFIWDPAEAALKHTLTAFRTFAYSPDGSIIVVDGRETGIFLLDALTGKKLMQIESYGVNDVVVTPDNQFIVVAGSRVPARYQQENLVYFLDVEKRNILQTIEFPGYPAPVMEIAYTPDGSAIVTIDAYGSIYVWDAKAGTLLQRFEEVVMLPADIHFIQGGRTLVITNGDNTIQYYEIGKNEIE